MRFAWYDCVIKATTICMQDRKRELEELIKKYSIGSITDVEREHLMKWMDDLDLSGNEPLEIDRVNRQMKERIDARLLLTETAIKIKHPSWHFFIKVAAVGLFSLSFSWYLLQRNRVEELQKVIQYVAVERTMAKSAKKICTVSRDSLILLQDGSRVRLLANSTLTWMQPFPHDQRAIQLQGKAFFEVVHDKSRPFTVLAHNILTTALGTSFWVIQDTKNAKPKVRLITGKVSIKERDENGDEKLLAYLTPGQIWKETVPLPKKELVLKAEKPTEAMVPTTLIFHHRSLAEVLPALASFYQTTILFSSGEVAGLSLYGTYTPENDVAQILRTICLANDLELKFNSETNTYTILKNSL